LALCSTQELNKIVVMSACDTYKRLSRADTDDPVKGALTVAAATVQVTSRLQEVSYSVPFHIGFVEWLAAT